MDKLQLRLMVFLMIGVQILIHFFDDSTDSQGIDLLGFSVCNDNQKIIC